MNSETIHRVIRDKQLASLGDAFVNFVYSLALTEINGRPEGTKVSDRILSEAFRLADLRRHLGTRRARKDLANAAESLLAEAYRRHLISIDESVGTLTQNPDGLLAGLSNLLKTAVDRISKSS
ncbi:MAG TPA: ribonuclease III family protein [Candidatus Dormibacteraeota bacterium]|nr:ribonuclease III family protein [Candidatus Dormibacteraeota bacterium]